MRTILLVLLCISAALLACTDSRHISSNKIIHDPQRKAGARGSFMRNGFAVSTPQLDIVEHEDGARQAEIMKEVLRFWELQGQTTRSKRYLRLIAQLWDDGIVPYEFHNISSSQETTVRDVMDIIEDYTCVRFYTEGSGEYEVSHDDYLSFMQAGGCWSWVGRYKAGQEISPCSGWTTVMHEIMHAMGFFHEQQRHDRDQYLQVNMENIVDGMEYNFGKFEKPEQFVPAKFDQQSIMMYGEYYFSEEYWVKKTIDYLYDDVPGHRADYWNVMKELSEGYKCATDCPATTCSNGGYLGFPLGSCGCICPENLDPNNHCDTLLSGVSGGVYYLDSNTRVVEFSTPDAPNAGVPANAVYTWMFFAPEDGSKIVVNIEEMNVAGSSESCTALLWINRDLVGQTGNAYCGDGYKKSIISVENVVVLTLEASSSTTSYLKGTATVRLANEWCYDLPGKGETYDGRKDRALTNEACLPWSQATACEEDPAQMTQQASYDNNYCRNPEALRPQPWCYTEINENGCVISLCDVCNFTRSYDINDDCADSVTADPLYCESDEAAYGCRDTCQLDVVTKTTTSPVTSPTTTQTTSPSTSPTTSTSASTTDSPTSGTPPSCPGNSTSPSPSVTTSATTVTSPTTSQTTSATSTTLPEACSSGYTLFTDGFCYRFSSDEKSRSDADALCFSQNSELTSVESQGLNDFLVDLRTNAGLSDKEMLLNAKWSEGEQHWYWVPQGEATAIGYSNWDECHVQGSSTHSCAVVSGEPNDNLWHQHECSLPAYYVCRKPSQI